MKIEVKIVAQTDQGLYYIQTESGEYMRIGKYEFCLIWDKDKTLYKAVELFTGMLVASTVRTNSGPLRETTSFLKEQLALLVADGDKMEKGMAAAQQIMIDQKEKFLAVIDSMPSFPVNQPLCPPVEMPKKYDNNLTAPEGETCEADTEVSE